VNSRGRRTQERAFQRHLRKVRLALAEKARRDARHEEKLRERENGGR
jgi:hypothetical protein